MPSEHYRDRYGGEEMSFEYDRPEGLLGAILAIEGIKDSATIVNGPTGCKYYPSSSSESAFPDRGHGTEKYNAFKHFKEFFFSQPRVPCTYLSGDDYVMGSGDKPDKAYAAVRECGANIIGIINSPGASLIGEQLALKEEKGYVVKMQSPPMSVSVGSGFQEAFLKVLGTISPKKKKNRKGVNLIGMSIWHLGWEDSVSDLRHLLGLCDIQVNTVLGAGCSVQEIKDSGAAEMNIMVHRDFGSAAAEWYRDHLDIPCTGSPMGAPIGFDALEDWILRVCKALGKDPSGAVSEIKSKRKRAADILSSLFADRRSVRGCTFSAVAGGSLAYPVMTFLYGHLGMLPVAVNTGMDTSFSAEISRFISEKGLDVTDDVFNTPADVMIGDGNNIASAVRRNLISGGYDVARHGLTNVNITERPVLGLGGTMRLLDGVLNILERSV